MCYSLGVLIWLGYPTLAVMLGVITTMLLYLKPELRGLSQGLTRQDLFSILQFAALSFVTWLSFCFPPEISEVKP